VTVTHTRGTSKGRCARAALAAVATTAATVGMAVLGAGAAGADTSSGTSSPAANQLGGYTLGSSASGMSVFYEQPNFPIPATPTLEFNFGYSASTFDAGPVGNANAAAVWPGAVIAGGGSQLPLLLDPYIQQYFAPAAPTLTPLIPNLGPWPFQAESAFPQGPASASDNNGPVSMDSTANQSESMATASVGLVGGPSSASALPAGMLTVQAVGSTAEDTIDNLGNAVSEATATVHGIDIAGSLIHIGEVSSTATSSSDGNQATLGGSSTAGNITVAGEAVTVDSSGLHVSTNSQNLLGPAQPSVDQVLSTAGITIKLTNPTDSVQGASGQRQLDGLAVTIDLSTYDQDLSKLMSMLPSQLTSGLAQLPVPAPYKQSITLDFGWVNVSAAASPAFNAELGTGSSGDTGGALATLGSGGTVPDSFGAGSIPLAVTGSTPSGGPTSSTSPAGGTTPTVIATAPVALFKGVGTGLIVLGLLLAGLLVMLLLRADKAVAALGTTAACVGEDLSAFR